MNERALPLICAVPKALFDGWCLWLLATIMPASALRDCGRDKISISETQEKERCHSVEA
jgi:hypothetical protein